MPGVLRDVLAELARVRKMSFREMESLIETNFERLIDHHSGLSRWYRNQRIVWPDV